MSGILTFSIRLSEIHKGRGLTIAPYRKFHVPSLVFVSSILRTETMTKISQFLVYNRQDQTKIGDQIFYNVIIRRRIL